MEKNEKKKVELLAPAGSPEKMVYAFQYGADAVYAGVPDFSMRARINTFDAKSLQAGIEMAHALKKKFYVTLNIYAHNVHLEKLIKHIKFLQKIKPDAIILSDPGILQLVKKYYPEAEIHLSTQANATNSEAVKFWAAQGIKRIILAREATLAEIREIRKANPKVELECFVHGAMCMSYSGRCILSKWMTGRSANLGDCVQACRWKYNIKPNGGNHKLKAMTVEDERGEVEMDVEEDQNGTYFFNSKDLNLLSYIDELVKAGVTSLKIEGRNKSVFYLAVATRAYRKVLDEIEKKSPKSQVRKVLKVQQQELQELMHRGYTDGFLLGDEPEHNFSNSHEEPKFQFVGEVLESRGNLLEAKIHNALRLDDELEVVAPDGNFRLKIEKILNDKMQEVSSAHGGQGRNYFLEVGKNKIGKLSLIRKKISI